MNYSEIVDSWIKSAKKEAYQDFASALICEITSQWGCDPQYYIGSNDKVESALAKNDVETIEMIRRLSKKLQKEIEE